MSTITITVPEFFYYLLVAGCAFWVVNEILLIPVAMRQRKITKKILEQMQQQSEALLKELKKSAGDQ